MTDEFTRELIEVGGGLGAILYGAHIRQNALTGTDSMSLGVSDATVGTVLMGLGAAGLLLYVLPEHR
jgi:hypothetical protein